MSYLMHTCNCIGPQNGAPYCPCMMSTKGVIVCDGRWIEPERDLGPARPRQEYPDFNTILQNMQQAAERGE